MQRTNVYISVFVLLHMLCFSQKTVGDEMVASIVNVGVSSAQSQRGTVIDIDGHVYQTVKIGSQEWMIDNLRVSKYNDNTIIDQGTQPSAWSTLTTGSWCWYNNNKDVEMSYGKLYNWYAVRTGKLCPTGWYVPSDVEWTALSDHLSGVDIAGGKLKQKGITHWGRPNTGATNESGFAGLPGGFRTTSGAFMLMGFMGNWWSSTASSDQDAWDRNLYHNLGSSSRNHDEKGFGFSVRCLKD